MFSIVAGKIDRDEGNCERFATDEFSSAVAGVKFDT
jgi:hypothetical protein